MKMTRLALIASIGLSLMLGGCLQPLYGPGVAGGGVRSALASIEVEPIPDRFGHYLRSELVYNLDGTGQPSAKTHKLTVQVASSLSTPLIDSPGGRADAAIVSAEAVYILKPIDDDKKTVLSGKVFANSSYDRSTQRFATLRAARDAEIRLAKELAEQIRTRLAGFMAGR